MQETRMPPPHISADAVFGFHTFSEVNPTPSIFRRPTRPSQEGARGNLEIKPTAQLHPSVNQGKNVEEPNASLNFKIPMNAIEKVERVATITVRPSK